MGAGQGGESGSMAPEDLELPEGKLPYGGFFFRDFFRMVVQNGRSGRVFDKRRLFHVCLYHRFGSPATTAESMAAHNTPKTGLRSSGSRTRFYSPLKSIVCIP